MRSYNFVVIDLVRDQNGELLAVSRGAGGWLNYHRTIKNGAEIDEDRTEHFFQRKSDIKKIRKSKDKTAMIDRLNLWILESNISFMAFALEQAEEQLYSQAEKMGYAPHGEDWYKDLPDSLVNMGNAAKLLDRGSRAYGNYLHLCFERGTGLYRVGLERLPEKWAEVGVNDRPKKY